MPDWLSRPVPFPSVQVTPLTEDPRPPPFNFPYGDEHSEGGRGGGGTPNSGGLGKQPPGHDDGDDGEARGSSSSSEEDDESAPALPAVPPPLSPGSANRDVSKDIVESLGSTTEEPAGQIKKNKTRI
ncbi:hypothetical protein IscW_ISCW022045 [Ixodes scapularis]|uniref:Uncharacterized protein n=1 Tax=Ixodes scapularis TaxID=6945 RepID=B7QD22_IXOSC|nr:hypothetical protein IscW_ISCW022045 [Ixodes scapularis]|eukprot:XP_002413436.1 hypothetical protein IscW_ISCW022045 [Ixodes scapularis]